jgi:hypothetical protein
VDAGVAAYRYVVEKGFEDGSVSNNRGVVSQVSGRTFDGLSLQGIEAAFDKAERAALGPKIAIVLWLMMDCKTRESRCFLKPRLDPFG